jgi:metal-responsive CopG/Arc/MetJ family transcriptional regulator
MKTKDRKITVSLASDLAQSVDNYVHAHPDTTNRSKVVESALRWWEVLRQYGDADKVFEDAMQLYKKQQEREAYRSYFANLSDEAKAEAAGWRQIGEETASRLMDKQQQ